MKKTIIIFTLFLCSCSLEPKYQKPDVTTSNYWKATQEYALESETYSEWWKSFNSPQLNQLIERGVKENLDLAVAIARVSQYQALLKQSKSANWMQADLSGGATSSKTKISGNPSSKNDTYNGDLSLSYQIDIWGKQSATDKAALANLQASKYNQQSVRLTVISEIATNYFQLLNYKERISIAKRNLFNQQEVLAIIEAQFKEGAASELDYRRQKASVEQTKASVAEIKDEYNQTINQLSVLLAYNPQDLRLKLEGTTSDINVPYIRPIQPNELILHRPDISKAEQDLIAANADIAIARAAFFPSLDIGADAIVSGSPTTTTLRAMSSLFAPIFSGGELTAKVKYSEEKKRELIKTYKSTILVAFKEAENALSAVNTAQLKYKFLANAYIDSNKSYDISKQQYIAGKIDFQTLLDTQREKFSSDENMQNAKLSKLTAAVDLFTALGGDYTKVEE